MRDEITRVVTTLEKRDVGLVSPFVQSARPPATRSSLRHFTKSRLHALNEEVKRVEDFCSDR
jgi:hypothetical protein